MQVFMYKEIDGRKIKLRGAYWFKTTHVNAPEQFKIWNFVQSYSLRKKQDIQIQKILPILMMNEKL